MKLETSELKLSLQLVADRCDESDPEQAAIKSILYSLMGAMVMGAQGALMDHVCVFTRQQMAEAQAQLQDMRSRVTEWPDTIG